MPYIGQPPVTGDTTRSFRLLDNIASYTLTFDGSSTDVVSVANDTLTFSQHRFVTAQRVTYNDGGGTAIGGLSDGVYFIIKVDQNTISLATSAANANAGTAIDLTSAGVGASHTLNVAFDGVNTKFKVTYGSGTKAKISRAGQLFISINGVIQQPQESATPTVGFGLEADSTLVFSTAPATSDVVFGQILADTITNFDTTDNTVDNFTGDGTTTAFSLSKSVSSNNDILVTIDGVVQYPTDTTTGRSYSVVESTLTFTEAPANSASIQVRHIGFAGATSSAVTGFYGRTGNVSLKTTDNIVVGNINSSGVATATNLVEVRSSDSTPGRIDYYCEVSNAHYTRVQAAPHAEYSGNVTATLPTLTGDFIVGDTASAISQNVNTSGIITASSFYGDGSTLTGIGQTVNVNTDSLNVSGISTFGNDLSIADKIIHTGDTNTAIRFPSADTVTFETGGSERARIDSSGRLLKSGQAALTSTSLNHPVQIAADSEAQNIVCFGRAADDIGEISFYEADKSTRLGELQYRQDIVHFRHRVGDIAFSTGGSTERARIDTSGRLLIGTSSSSGDAATNSQLVVAGSSVNANGAIALTRNSANPTSGQGIGHIFFADSGGGRGAAIQGQSDGTWGSSDYPGRLVFQTTPDGGSSPQERLRIDSTGRVTTKTATNGEIDTLSDGATITPNFNDSNLFTVTLGGNRTLANPSNITAGQSGSIFVVQDGTGSRTLSFGSYWDFVDGTAPTLTTTASAVDRIDYVVRTSTSIHAVFTANYS